MEPDYAIKDKILEALVVNNANGKGITPSTISSHLSISKQRASKCLEQIFSDAYCTKRNAYGIDDLLYRSNQDTEPFLLSGGYTKTAKNEEERENLKFEQLDYSVQELKKKLKNYDKIEKRAEKAYRNSTISITIAVLMPLVLLLLKWKCNIP